MLNDAELKYRWLQPESRRKIYERIRVAPGVHVRRMERELGIPMSTLKHHLRRLEREGFVVVHPLGQKKCYFLQEAIDRRDLRCLSFLRQRHLRRIVEAILGEPYLTQQDLSRRLDIGAPTVSYHIKRLERGGILEGYWLHRRKCYRFLEAERLERLLRTYWAAEITFEINLPSTGPFGSNPTAGSQVPPANGVDLSPPSSPSV